jgi:hypothetical protein
VNSQAISRAVTMGAGYVDFKGRGAANDIPLKTLERIARRGIDVGCTASGCRRFETDLSACDSEK